MLIHGILVFIIDYVNMSLFILWNKISQKSSCECQCMRQDIFWYGFIKIQATKEVHTFLHLYQQDKQNKQKVFTTPSNIRKCS